jgi:hypothetical protein
MAQNWMAPWLSLWGGANNNEPLSGDVSQWFRLFSPSVTVNGEGDPELEGRIVRDVATYGAQLGQITEIVLAMADGAKPPAEALEKLKRINAEIVDIKKTHTENALARARAALDDLKDRDPEGYKLLLASLKGSGR